MSLRVSVRSKVITLVLLITVIVFVIPIGYLVSVSRGVMLDDSYRMVRLSAERSALQVRSKLEHYMGLTYALAKSFEGFPSLPPSRWQALHLDMLQRVYREYPDLLSIWDSYEYSSYRAGYDRPYGRLSRQVYFTPLGELRSDVQELSMSGDPPHYSAFKAKNYAGIWEPYMDNVSRDEGLRVLMTTVAAPIQEEGRFAGLVGVDISLNWLQELVKELKPMSGSQAFILSNGGLVVAHAVDTLVMHRIGELFPSEARREHLAEAVRDGEPVSFMHVDGGGTRHYVYLTPVRVDKSGEHWSVGVSVPLNMLTASADRSTRIAVVATSVALLVLVILLVVMINRLVRPLVQLTASLHRLGRGELDEDLCPVVRSGDELEVMGCAVRDLLDGLRGKEKLVRSLREEDFTREMRLLSNQDQLGLSLLSLQEHLRSRRSEVESQRAESVQRRWASEGFARFSDMLRSPSASTEELTNLILPELVAFMKASLGAIYLLDAERLSETGVRYYALHSVYGWDRRRFVDKVGFESGVGLVGSCAMERAPVYVTDVPEDYIRIPVGVGALLPKSLLLLPLLYEGETLGVVELARLEGFEQYEVDFLSTLCETIAAAIHSVIQENELKGVLERTQQRVVELDQEVEGLINSVEALDHRSQISDRRIAALERQLGAIGGVLFYFEADPQGLITAAGSCVLEQLRRREDQVVGTHFSEWIRVSGWRKQQFDSFWQEVISGAGQQLQAQLYGVSGDVEVHEFYIPVRNLLGHAERVMILAYRTSENSSPEKEAPL